MCVGACVGECMCVQRVWVSVWMCVGVFVYVDMCTTHTLPPTYAHHSSYLYVRQYCVFHHYALFCAGLVEYVDPTYGVADVLSKHRSIQNFFKASPGGSLPSGDITPEVMDNYVRSCGEYNKLDQTSRVE